MSNVPLARICKKAEFGGGTQTCQVYVTSGLSIRREFNGSVSVCTFAVLIDIDPDEAEYDEAEYGDGEYVSSEPDVSELDDVLVYTPHGNSLFTGVVTSINTKRIGLHSCLYELTCLDAFFFFDRSVTAISPFQSSLFDRELIAQNSGSPSVAIFNAHFSRDRMQAVELITDFEVSNVPFGETVRRIAAQMGTQFWIDGYGFFNYRLLPPKRALFGFSDKADTNLITSSEDLGDGTDDVIEATKWEHLDVSITLDQANGPGGEPSIADLVTLAGSSGSVGKLAAVERDIPHTFSIYVRTTSGTLSVGLHGDGIERVQNLVVDCFALTQGLQSPYWKVQSSAVISGTSGSEQAPWGSYLPLPSGHINSTRVEFAASASSGVYQQLGQINDPTLFPHRAGLAIDGMHYLCGVWAKAVDSNKNFNLHLENEDIVSGVRTLNGNETTAEFTAVTDEWRFFALSPHLSDTSYLRVSVLNGSGGTAGDILFSGFIVCPCSSATGEFAYKDWFTSDASKISAEHILNPYIRVSRDTDSITADTSWQQLAVTIPAGVPVVHCILHSAAGPSSFLASKAMLERGSLPNAKYQFRSSNPTTFMPSDEPSFSSNFLQYVNISLVYGDGATGVNEDTSSVQKYGNLVQLIVDRSLTSSAQVARRAAAEVASRQQRVWDIGVTTLTEGLEFGDITQVWSEVRRIYGIDVVVRSIQVSVEGNLVKQRVQLGTELRDFTRIIQNIQRLVQPDRL